MKSLLTTQAAPPNPSGRGRRWPFEHICAFLRELVKHSPGDFGYQRSRWSTELLAGFVE
jgi:hypothetical protein